MPDQLLLPVVVRAFLMLACRVCVRLPSGQRCLLVSAICRLSSWQPVQSWHGHVRPISVKLACLTHAGHAIAAGGAAAAAVHAARRSAHHRQPRAGAIPTWRREELCAPPWRQAAAVKRWRTIRGVAAAAQVHGSFTRCSLIGGISTRWEGRVRVWLSDDWVSRQICHCVVCGEKGRQICHCVVCGEKGFERRTNSALAGAGARFQPARTTR